jgi:hypothetical protein
MGIIKEQNKISKSIRASTMRIKMANTMKKDKIIEFKQFYENKFEPVNKNILSMIERTPREFVPNRLKCQF